MFADYVFKTIDGLPITSHPMTQFASGVMALQVEFITSSDIHIHTFSERHANYYF